MHIAEIGDFLLGWFGFDIKNDDLKPAAPQATPEKK